ncbi:hypothetical protein E5288_WYG014803 [Bos mutus]|uniref:Uncharacterized protein n=1 Tax=Bos mutus TaxID=72004 RepID=A0A6B0S4Z6_9CETA|nr:hypothetical protein [Bos mutus]
MIIESNSQGPYKKQLFLALKENRLNPSHPTGVDSSVKEAMSPPGINGDCYTQLPARVVSLPIMEERVRPGHQSGVKKLRPWLSILPDIPQEKLDRIPSFQNS